MWWMHQPRPQAPPPSQFEKLTDPQLEGLAAIVRMAYGEGYGEQWIFDALVHEHKRRKLEHDDLSRAATDFAWNASYRSKSQR